jgi:DNA-binding SARP family transcriptional activator/tetratricopeptide (TPR) repeat protein
MRFCLLGPLAVSCGDTVIPVPAGKQRAVLAALLLRANRVVTVADLAETLWGTAPPPSARVTVQNYVVRLRRALGAEGHSRIGTQPRGYVINVAADELDLTQFEVLLGEARQAARDGSWDTAAAQARAALALWRGEPLADVESELLAVQEVPRLADLRMIALLTRIEADLQLGRHAEVTGELRHLAAAHPLREHLHALLMLALYREGRQAEALATYQLARRILLEELGTEPGHELRSLQQQILVGDPALNPAGPQRPGGGEGQGVPRELPAGVRHFTGRAAELAALTRLLEEPAKGPGVVVIGAIGGTAGVGKTALAVHWAHQIAGQFPDGQLYVNLRGFDADRPMAAAEAIRGFLDALGVPPERIPPLPEAQGGLYRSLLADKRMLIVADNARDEQQVRPLFPASPGCVVLVTSRSQLGGLGAADGARLVILDVLSHAEAVQLLAARLGAARAAAEPAALDRIARLCACLPLALAVAAASATARPGFSLATLVAELADSARRLDALDVGDPGSSVRAVFSWSTQQLSSEAARMFRLLGIHPGPDISVPAAASLAGLAEPDTRRLLHELGRAHLITEHVPGRYAFHDLLRAYAAEQSQHTDSRADRDAAIGRVLDHYLHTGVQATLLLDPAREPVVLAEPRPGAAPRPPADRQQAMAWFEAEHQVLLAALTLAAGSGFDSHAWQLPWAMTTFHQSRAHWQEWVATQRTALAAATRLGDSAAQAISSRLLASAYSNFGDQDRALGYYAKSRTLYQRLGNRLGEAKIEQNLTVVAERQGRYTDALRHAEQALRLCQAVGDKANEAEALNAVGWYHGYLGDYEKARTFCYQAITICIEVGHNRLEADAWDSVGLAEHHLGNLAEAATCYQHALSLYREAGYALPEAHTLTRLGDTRHAGGQVAEAREAWQQALVILEDLQNPEADEIRAKLASTMQHARSRPH